MFRDLYVIIVFFRFLYMCIKRYSIFQLASSVMMSLSTIAVGVAAVLLVLATAAQCRQIENQEEQASTGTRLSPLLKRLLHLDPLSVADVSNIDPRSVADVSNIDPRSVAGVSNIDPRSVADVSNIAQAASPVKKSDYRLRTPCTSAPDNQICRTVCTFCQTKISMRESHLCLSQCQAPSSGQRTQFDVCFMLWCYRGRLWGDA